MNKFKYIYETFILENKKYEFVGTCVNSFDEDGDCIVNQLPYSTASDFAGDEEEAEEISEKDFKKIIITDKMVPKSHKISYYKSEQDVVMAYDEDDDIHYFFV